MLTSLSVNGDIPGAVVLVAGFGLTGEDKHILRAGAGLLARRLHVIDITHEMLKDVDPGRYTDAYPVAVLGRLFLPYEIRVRGARLLTLDSDMIVNASVRPLFELDLQGAFFAAVHDPPHRDNLAYFNSGMMLADVDGYVEHDVGRRCLLWLGAQVQQPQWPDQDALTAIIGDDWYRLDRSWNLYSFESTVAFRRDYEQAKIAHFAASPKPWDQADHQARPLYDRYLDELRSRLVGQNGGRLNRLSRIATRSLGAFQALLRRVRRLLATRR